MKFKDINLGLKQVVGFGAVLFLLSVVNSYSFLKLNSLKADLERVTANWMPRIIAISEVNLNTSYLRTGQLEHAVANHAEQRRQLQILMVAYIDIINENLEEFEQLIDDTASGIPVNENERVLYQSFDSKWEEYQNLTFEYFSLIEENNTDSALTLLNNEARLAFVGFSQDLQLLVELNFDNARQASATAEETIAKTRRFNVTIFIISLLIAIVMITAIIRLVTKPLKRLINASHRVAEGDLDVQIEILANDEVGRLSRSFNEMTAALKTERDKTSRQADALTAQAEALKIINEEVESKNIELERTLLTLRETQQQLLLKEKMASLGDLVAGVAHEINNPIGAILSTLDTTLRCAQKIENELNDPNGPDPEHTAKYLRIIKTNSNLSREAGERIANLVTSLRHFARLDEAEFQQVDLHEGLEHTITLLSPECASRVTIVREFGELPQYNCNAAQMNQVFMNIIKNAAQAIIASGVITISTSVIEREITIRISDTGRGIDPERLEHIFDFNFTSGGNRIKLGSGLSSALKIVQEHQGNLTIDSELGQGTTVTVILPVQV